MQGESYSVSGTIKKEQGKYYLLAATMKKREGYFNPIYFVAIAGAILIGLFVASRKKRA
jgi:Ni,Fe-hydrogenase I cytochrome b subunit